MAVKELTPVKGVLNKITEFTFEAATVASDGMQFKLPRMSDEYVVVIAKNSDASTAYDLTIKKPTKGSYAAASADEVHELAAGEYAIFRFESAKFANNDGTVLIVPENAAVKVAVLY